MFQSQLQYSFAYCSYVYKKMKVFYYKFDNYIYYLSIISLYDLL